MARNLDPLDDDSLTRAEIGMAGRWRPVVGARFARMIAFRAPTVYGWGLLAPPLGIVGFFTLRHSVPLGGILILIQLTILITTELFYADRRRKVHVAMSDGLKRLGVGLEPKSPPRLRAIAAFERWLVTENLTRDQIKQASSLAPTPEIGSAAP